MDLKDIKFVIDLISVDDVNGYLQKGWILIKTYTTNYDPEISADNLKLHYILGATDKVDYSKELSKLNEDIKTKAAINEYFS